MDFFASCTNEQKQAILHGTGPAMILAGPGSGKTFVVTRRLKYLIEVLKVPPRQIGVITFTKAAAMEMRDRAISVCREASQTAFGTFHSFFYQILKSYSLYSDFTIVTEDEKTNILRQILFTRYSDIRLINQKIPCLKNAISYFLNTNTIQDEFLDTSEFFLVLEQYKKECFYRKKLDFDMILSECLSLLQTNETVRRRWQHSFRYFLIDEYQDTNDMQFRMLNLLAHEHRNLFVVGDDDQSIYRFRGADPTIMFRFLQTYPDAKQITLEENFRSKKKIVDFAGQSIRNNVNRFAKQIFCHRQEDGEVFLLKGKDREEEVDFLIKSILDRRQKGIKDEEIGILCRTANLFPYLCMKLKKSGILCESQRETKAFYSEETVEDILCYLRYVFQGRKRKELFPVLNRPERCLSRSLFTEETVDFAMIRENYQTFWMKHGLSGGVAVTTMNREENVLLESLQKLEMDTNMLEKLDSYGCICYILYGIGYETYCLAGKDPLEQERQRELFEQLKIQAKLYPNVLHWLEEVERIRGEKVREEATAYHVGKGVKLLTYHASKGLEFPHVYLPFLNQYIVPHKKAVTVEEIEEERRMFYVAVTRARDSLTLSYVSNQGSRPSQFVEECIDTVHGRS